MFSCKNVYKWEGSQAGHDFLYKSRSLVKLVERLPPALNRHHSLPSSQLVFVSFLENIDIPWESSPEHCLNNQSWPRKRRTKSRRRTKKPKRRRQQKPRKPSLRVRSPSARRPSNCHPCLQCFQDLLKDHARLSMTGSAACVQSCVRLRICYEFETWLDLSNPIKHSDEWPPIPTSNSSH